MSSTGIISEIKTSITDTLKHISTKNRYEQFICFFWLMGPFIFLIERSPADAWVIIIDVAFLVYCFKNNIWSWIKQPWVLATIIFWLICILSSLLSPEVFKSLPVSIGWIRFPLYACAAQVMFGEYKYFRVAMLISMAIGMVLMTIILSLEAIIEPKVRLSWPYGDLIPGGYLAKAVLPATIVAFALISHQFNKFSALVLSVLFWSMGITIIVGERIHMIMRFSAALLSIFTFKFNKAIASMLCLIFVVLGILTFYLIPSVYYRFGSYFYHDNPLLNFQSSYWDVWKTGIAAFQIHPIIGIGPGNIRHLCHEKLGVILVDTSVCSNHPHQYYFQIAGETGIVGLLSAISMIFLIILHCWHGRQQFTKSIIIRAMGATAFITPLAIFFPIQSTGNFFGQWSNLFIWVAVGFAIMQNQSYKNK